MKFLSTLVLAVFVVPDIHGQAMPETTLQSSRQETIESGAIIRMDSTQKVVFLVFTGHEFADGGMAIRRTLRKNGIKASFFFTGDFYRNPLFARLIRGLVADGNYLGGHSDRHLLYAPWTNRDSLLLDKDQFMEDLSANYGVMAQFGITRSTAPWFLPPFEWYNGTIVSWSREAGLRVVNFTPGTRSNADYTIPGVDANYVSADEIVFSILRREELGPRGLNGFLLLMHIGTDPRRTDKLYDRLDGLIHELKRRGYSFRRLPREEESTP
jgi:peptidoglycan/xylan/chitin deacetylase (PgdA/CDA1 family)